MTIDNIITKSQIGIVLYYNPFDVCIVLLYYCSNLLFDYLIICKLIIFYILIKMLL